jgi:hypothetical protein
MCKNQHHHMVQVWMCSHINYISGFQQRSEKGSALPDFHMLF